jgi:glycosyltransferase involved in cell wall biosynthesis
MIKRGSRSLCFESNPFACNNCTGLPAASVATRRNTLLSLFELVDTFVSPSEFVRQRYVSWGLPASKFVVIENGQEISERAGRPLQDRKTPNRFGYFGQINPYKGVDVLLGAAASLVREGFEDFVIEINGANLGTQPSDHQKEIMKLLQPLLESGNVLWNGPYGREELADRIERVDWVVMPSVWWENSPMVIQEAYLSRRPVICSGIGGMAEKVRDGVHGLHVPVGSTRSWADTIRRSAADKDAHRRMSQNLPTPPSLQESAISYARLSESSAYAD